MQAWVVLVERVVAQPVGHGGCYRHDDGDGDDDGESGYADDDEAVQDIGHANGAEDCPALFKIHTHGLDDFIQTDPFGGKDGASDGTAADVLLLTIDGRQRRRRASLLQG